MAIPNNKKKLGLAAGLGALAAAAAGAYYLYGTQAGVKRRQKIRGWMLKARGEILDRLESLKEVDKETYHRIIDQVLKRYGGVKNVRLAEIAALAKDLKSHWKNIKQELGQPETQSRPRKRRTRRKPTSS